jgi:hypothetical protein
MIPCTCGEPTCPAADNIEKVRQFCLTHTLRLVRASDGTDRVAPIWPLDIQDFIADRAGVPRHLPYVSIEGGHDAIGLAGTYTLRVDCGGGVFGIECWVLPVAVNNDLDSVGNYADKHAPRLTPISQPAETMKGIPDPDRVTSWGDDEFWVRTTDSLVGDIKAHRKMLDEKIVRLKSELASAETERGTFEDRIGDAAAGL